MSTDLEWLRDNKDLIVGELGEDASLIQELEQELQLAAETPSPLLHDGAAPSASKWAGKLEECRMVDPSLPPAPAPAPAAPAGQSSSGGGHARDAWLRETDPATGYPYWYNTETGDSCWEHEVAEPPRTTARAPDVPPVSRQPTSVTERRANQERGNDDLSSSSDGDDDDDDDDDCCCCLGRPKPRSQYKAIELHGS